MFQDVMSFLFLLFLLLDDSVKSCDEKSFNELIETSPVILKALVGRIDLASNKDLIDDDNGDDNEEGSGSVFVPLSLSSGTVYKGAFLLRKLEDFSSSQYFELNTRQLNASLHRPLRCFDNNILHILPTQLIVFGTLDNNKQLLVETNGLKSWNEMTETKVWKHLGWSEWSDYTPCSISCGRGVQQRFRRCLLDKSKVNNKKFSSLSSSSLLWRKWKTQPLRFHCEGYNVEQRNCNMFECTGAVDLLAFSSQTKQSINETSRQDLKMSVGQMGDNFTIMITLRTLKSESATLVSIRSLHESNLFVEMAPKMLKLIQEKFDLSETFIVDMDLADGRWHQIAISCRNGNHLTIYVDCIWRNTFVVSRGLITLPHQPDIEMGHHFSSEINQLIIMPGLQEKLQCTTERTPIVEDRQFIVENILKER